MFPNEVLLELRRSIDDYCSWLRRRWRGAEGYALAQNLRMTVRRFLPGITKCVEQSAPDLIFANSLLEFAVKGLALDHVSLIWQRYFLEGTTVAEVAEETGYSTRSVNRWVKGFPERIARQLWEKNQEIVEPRPPVRPGTSHQARVRFLQEVFFLSERQAEVLLVYCRPGKEKGRNAIADELFITQNTLKSHTRKIIRKMGAKNMNHAAAIAKEALRKHPPADWRW